MSFACAPPMCVRRTWGGVALGLDLAMGLPVKAPRGDGQPRSAALEPGSKAFDGMMGPGGFGRGWVETCARFRRLGQDLHRPSWANRVHGPGSMRLKM
jgi:hypothetical protein